MHAIKKLVSGAVLLLAVLGIGVAAANLPIRTGCDFYARCPDGLQAQRLGPPAQGGPADEE